MHKLRTTSVLVLLVLAGAIVGMGALAKQGEPAAEAMGPRHRALKAITLNTPHYSLSPTKGDKQSIDNRSIQITAEEDMHIVALEHFIGVYSQGTHHGHILSTSPDNPWGKSGRAMEANGTKGYFGHCRWDNQTEEYGSDNTTPYQTFPGGTHVLVRQGETLYLHCWAWNDTRNNMAYVHHMVRVLYW